MTNSRQNNEASVVVNRPAYNVDSFEEKHGFKCRESTLIEKLQKFTRKQLQCSWKRFYMTFLSYFPVALWLPKYKAQYFPGDLISGWTVGIIRIPQGMAYALLANVAPVYGLYTSFFSVLLWFIFSTSKHTSIGTMAIVCLMIRNVVDRYVPETPVIVPSFNDSLLIAPNGQIIEDTNHYLQFMVANDSTNHTWFDGKGYIANELSYRDNMRIQIASTATLLVGIIQLCMGFLHLGFLTNFLSDPVVQGFTTGAAFHVMTSQVKYIFGLDKEIGKYSGPFALMKTFRDIFQNLGSVNVAEVIISSICLPLIFVAKHFNDKYKEKMRNIPFPIELVLVVAGTCASYFGDFKENFNVNIVANIPTGFPNFAPPRYVNLWGEMFTDCLIIAIVSFAISLSLTKIYSDKHGYEVDADQELIALGVCNAIPAFLSSFAIAASLSRTAIQESSGGNTQLVSILSSVLMFIVLLWIGPWFEPAPKSVLACIIVAALKGLFMQFERLKPLWYVSKIDFCVWIISMLAVVFLGVDVGLAVGVGSALFALLFRIKRPNFVILGRVSGSDIYSDINSCSSAREIAGIKIYQFTDSPTYNNKELFKDSVSKAVGFNPALQLAKQNKKKKNESNKKGKCFQLSNIAPFRDSGIASNDSEYKNKDDGVSNMVVETGSTENSVKFQKSLRLNMTDESLAAKSPLIKDTKTDILIFHTFIFDASKWSYIDSTATRDLCNIVNIFQKLNIKVYFSAASVSILETLQAGGMDKKFTHKQSFVTLHDAVVTAEKEYRLTVESCNSDDEDVPKNLPDYPGYDALAL